MLALSEYMHNCTDIACRKYTTNEITSLTWTCKTCKSFDYSIYNTFVEYVCTWHHSANDIRGRTQHQIKWKNTCKRDQDLTSFQSTLCHFIRWFIKEITKLCIHYDNSVCSSETTACRQLTFLPNEVNSGHCNSRCKT